MQTFLELRLDRNLTKKAVSQATGISAYKIKKFESGDFKQQYAYDFARLAYYYNVKPSELLEDKN